MPSLESILADASLLPLSERIQLIEALRSTVPDEPLPELSAEWIAEVKRRSAEYDAGMVEAVPWETIRADARNRAGQQRGDVIR